MNKKINLSRKSVNIESPKKWWYVYNINDPDLYWILDTLEKWWSRLNVYVEGFGITLKQILSE